MRKFKLFNPVARAIAVIGSVTALATGVTFAALQSNTVALAPNTLAAASASLAIGAGTSCPEGDTTTTPGFTNVKLVPGEESDPVAFCLDNTGDVDLDMFAQITTDFTGSAVPANQVTLTIACDTIGTVTGTLDSYSAFKPFTSPLTAADADGDHCEATALLNAGFSGSGSVTSFGINFVGNQVATTP